METRLPQIDDATLDRYLVGESTPGERELVEHWISAEPGRGRNVQAWQTVWQGEAVPDAAGERIWDGLRTVKRQDGALSHISLRGWVGYAAVGILFSVISWQVFQSKSNNPVSVPEIFTTYTTKSGQRASLTLGDGSHVTLGPATTLRVQKGMDPNSEIAVEVNGEALFSVAHAVKHPFTVTAHGVIARVLGTEFIVRAYDVSLVRVAVRDGRVSVQSPVFTSANAAIVNAGEAVSAAPNVLPVVTPITDIATDFAWANGELVLRKVPLGEAFVRLSRWYGMEFRVTDPALLEAKISAVFPSSFSQSSIDVLGIAIKANVNRSGNVITFSTAP